MPKLKSKKTLLKRIKITGTGKIIKKQTRIGHLKRKWSTNRKFRKRRLDVQENKGHIKVFRQLLGKLSKGVKRS
jgi:large subunit ribosomal protein L35